MDWKQATEQDLIDLIDNKQQENHYLDFKRRESLTETGRDERRKELGKDISAFAHADGGTIIFGMEEEGKLGEAARLAGFTQSELTKERLTQLIQTSTEPPVIGVFVHPIELQDRDKGKWAFVVTIPQATTCHQAHDKKFHRRDNADTRAMHRDEIIDVLNRARGPKLQLNFHLDGGKDAALINWQTRTTNSQAISLSVGCENQEKIALYALSRLWVEQSNGVQISRASSSGFTLSFDPKLRGLEAMGKAHSIYKHTLTVPPSTPIFTGDATNFGLFNIILAKEVMEIDKNIWIMWECIAPDMVNARGGVTIHKLGEHLRLGKLDDLIVNQAFGT